MADVLKNLTPRDVDVLNALYQFRALTVSIIHEFYFGNKSNKDYTYQRLSLLRQSGYVNSDPLVDVQSGRKLTSSYYVTDRGIKALYDKGMIDKITRSKDIRVNGRSLDFRITVNNIFFELVKYGWRLYSDSRMIKAEYNLNRNSLIQGVICSPNKEEFAFYLLSSNPMDKTIKQMAREISELVAIKKVMVLCNSENGYNALLKVLNTLKGKVVVEVHIYTDEYGLLLLRALYSKEGILALYSRFGAVTTCNVEFASYSVVYKKESMYIVELITHKPSIKQELFKYTPAKFREDGKRVLVLVSPEEEEKVKNEFRDYSHITFHSLSKEIIHQISNITLLE